MNATECHICKKPLTGGLDTFGEVRFPVCFDCFWWDEPDQTYIGFVRCGTCRQGRATVEEVVYDAVGLAIIDDAEVQP